MNRFETRRVHVSERPALDHLGERDPDRGIIPIPEAAHRSDRQRKPLEPAVRQREKDHDRLAFEPRSDRQRGPHERADRRV